MPVQGVKFIASNNNTGDILSPVSFMLMNSLSPPVSLTLLAEVGSAIFLGVRFRLNATFFYIR
jgi:hypothetical protein